MNGLESIKKEVAVLGFGEHQNSVVVPSNELNQIVGQPERVVRLW